MGFFDDFNFWWLFPNFIQALQPQLQSEWAWDSSRSQSHLDRWLDCVLHVRYIPCHNSQRPFWASACVCVCVRPRMADVKACWLAPLYWYICTYLHTRMCTHVPTCKHTCIPHTPIPTYIPAYLRPCVCTSVRTYVPSHLRTYVPILFLFQESWYAYIVETLLFAHGIRGSSKTMLLKGALAYWSSICRVLAAASKQRKGCSAQLCCTQKTTRLKLQEPFCCGRNTECTPNLRSLIDCFLAKGATKNVVGESGCLCVHWH